MATFQDLNEAGLLAIALMPEWVDQTTYTGAPASNASGVDLRESPRAMFKVALREHISKRTSRVVVTNGDTATTYTVEIDGNPVATTPASSAEADVAEEIKDDINADGTVNTIVVASIDPDDETGATVLIEGLAEADYSIDATVAAGTGTVTFSADASSAELRIYVADGGIIRSGSVGYPNGWTLPFGGDYGAIDYRGFNERLDIAGCSRGYIEVHTIAGHASDGVGVVLNVARVGIGPAVLEASI